MDLSGVIFVALALAWAVYLIPKALKHHDEVVHSRSIDRFSHTMRVLARREPVKDDAHLDAQVDAHVDARPAEEPVPLTPAQQRARKQAIAKATRRRRNVLSLLLLALVATTGVAAAGVISWWYLAIPGGLIVAWLVTCRIMVKGERRRPTMTRVTTAGHQAADEADESAAMHVEVERNDQGFDELAPESETATVAAVASEEGHQEAGLWDPLPMTLPTYVGKPTAERRSVRDISIDDSGVWTSGRTESDAAIAREADAQRRSERAARAEAARRAVGS